MVGISDGNNDGRFKIQRGQGLSQAIATELGLNAQQCKKLGSVWSEIFKEVDKQNQQTKIYYGGNNLSGPTNKNYVVHTNQVIEFSKEIWAKIVQLVNEKLGTNIEVAESTAPPAANEAPATNPPVANEPPANNNPTAAEPPANEPPPAPPQHTVSMAGTAPNTKFKSYRKEAPNLTAAVNQLKAETQSNWAVSSNMKDALKHVTNNNVAYFVQQYNKDGSNIVKDIDGCTGWNKKDVYTNLTSKLIARAKEQGINISKYNIEAKTVKTARAVGNSGATTQVSTTEYPSLEAQQKFLNEVSTLIVEGEFVLRYKAQITKANSTIKKFANAPVENITLEKPEDPKNGNYNFSLGDNSFLNVNVKNGVVTRIEIQNSSSPDLTNDLSYNFEMRNLSLDPDEKSNDSGYYKLGRAFNSSTTPIPFDKLKGVATELLKKMGVEVSG